MDPQNTPDALALRRVLLLAFLGEDGFLSVFALKGRLGWSELRVRLTLDVIDATYRARLDSGIGMYGPALYDLRNVTRDMAGELVKASYAECPQDADYCDDTPEALIDAYVTKILGRDAR